MGGCLGRAFRDEEFLKELGCCVMTNDIRAMLDVLQRVCNLVSKIGHAASHLSSQSLYKERYQTRSCCLPPAGLEVEAVRPK